MLLCAGIPSGFTRPISSYNTLPNPAPLNIKNCPPIANNESYVVPSPYSALILSPAFLSSNHKEALMKFGTVYNGETTFVIE